MGPSLILDSTSENYMRIVTKEEKGKSSGREPDIVMGGLSRSCRHVTGNHPVRNPIQLFLYLIDKFI
jgi:hypothetical protein